MFKSNGEVDVNTSILSIIYCILGVGNSFLQVLWFIFLNLDKNMTVPFFFCWLNVVDTHSDLFNSLNTLSWKIFSTYFLKKDSCYLDTGYDFTWYSLVYACSSLYTGLVFLVPGVPKERNLCLLNILRSMYLSSSVKFFL